MNPILQKYKAKDKKDFKKKLKKAKAAAEGQKTKAMKDFEERGFIKVKKEGIEILDKEGLMKYYEEFGKSPDHFPKVVEDE